MDLVKIKDIYINPNHVVNVFCQPILKDGIYVIYVNYDDGSTTEVFTERKEELELLKENGFTVTKHTDVYDDICCEDVYYRISWEEHKNLWQRIKERFC